MGSIFKTIGWEVAQLVDGVKTGKIQLPDLQRPFVWSSTKVRDLFDSMYRGYPVGELMFWDSRTSDESYRAISSSADHTVAHQIIDGQQRLTSLFAAMTGTSVRDVDYNNRRISISFNPFTERFEVKNSALERSANWITDISEFFDNQYKAKRAFKRRYAEANEELNDEQDEALEEVFERLSNLNKYTFNVIHVGNEVDKSIVADIFVRINSEGAALAASDYILTWLSVFWPEGRETIENFARNSRMSPQRVSEIEDEKVTWTPQNPFIELDTKHVVRALVAIGLGRARLQDAYSALQAKDRVTGVVNQELFETNLQALQDALPLVTNHLNWTEFIHSLQIAGFKSRKNITSSMNVIYSYVIFVLGRTRYNVELKTLREIVAQWVFMSQLTGRYTGSSESQMGKDLAMLEGLEPNDSEGFIRTLQRVIQAVLPDDFWSYSLPERLVGSNPKLSPWYQCYLAALNNLEAKMFMLDMPVAQWMDPHIPHDKGMETHHLFPDNYLRTELGVSDYKRRYQIANFAPTDWDTNIKISDSPPSDYWPQLVARSGMTEAALEQQRYWHALPNNWESLPYDEFLDQRRYLIAQVTRDGFRLLQGGESGADMTDLSVTFADEPDATLTDLLEAGSLNAGDLLDPVDPDWQVDAVISDDGTILIDGIHDFDSLDAAAKHLGVDNISGLEFWALESGDELLPLTSLASEPRSA